MPHSNILLATGAAIRLMNATRACVVVAQELQGRLFLLRWPLAPRLLQLLAGGGLVFLDHRVGRVVQQHALGVGHRRAGDNQTEASAATPIDLLILRSSSC